MLLPPETYLTAIIRPPPGPPPIPQTWVTSRGGLGIFTLICRQRKVTSFCRFKSQSFIFTAPLSHSLPLFGLDHILWPRGVQGRKEAAKELAFLNSEKSFHFLVKSQLYSMLQHLRHIPSPFRLRPYFMAQWRPRQKGGSKGACFFKFLRRSHFVYWF